jgi:tartrate-resistant acid phosphatase type 5
MSKKNNTEQTESLILKEKTKIPFVCDEVFLMGFSIFLFGFLTILFGAFFGYFYVDSLDNSLSFIIIGDFGYYGKGNQMLTAKSLGNFCAKNKCDFILSTGDNFYPAGVNSVNDVHWKQSFEDVYNHDSIKNLKWYSILGNRDYRQNPTSQIEYSSLKSNISWNMMNNYFSFEKSFPNIINPLRLNFLTLDTTPFINS